MRKRGRGLDPDEPLARRRGREVAAGDTAAAAELEDPRSTGAGGEPVQEQPPRRGHARTPRELAAGSWEARRAVPYEQHLAARARLDSRSQGLDRREPLRLGGSGGLAEQRADRGRKPRRSGLGREPPQPPPRERPERRTVGLVEPFLLHRPTVTSPATGTRLGRDGPSSLPRHAVLALRSRTRSTSTSRARRASLRRLGHETTVLAPSGRAADLPGGTARAGERGASRDDRRRRRPCRSHGAAAWACPSASARTSRSRSGRAAFDVVHGFEPGLPSLSYLALRETETLAVATFLSPERLGYPPRASASRRVLLGRIDALLATSPETAAAAAERFPGDYRVVSAGVDLERFRPGEKRRLVGRRAADGRARARPRGPARAPRARRLGARCSCGRSDSRAGPRSRSGFATARTSGRHGTPRPRAEVLAEAAVFVPAPGGARADRARGGRRGLRRRRAARRRGAAGARRSRAGPARRGRRAASAGSAPRPAPRPRGRASRASPLSSTSSTAAVASAAATRRGAAAARRPARRPRVDRRRPAHAHELVARLLDRGARAARPRRGGGTRRDRGHRPQRLRRRARGGRGRTRPRPRRHPGRGGEDRRARAR